MILGLLYCLFKCLLGCGDVFGVCFGVCFVFCFGCYRTSGWSYACPNLIIVSVVIVVVLGDVGFFFFLYVCE